MFGVKTPCKKCKIVWSVTRGLCQKCYRAEVMSGTVENWEMKNKYPAWKKCPGCEDFYCTIHDMHVRECECPPIDELDFDPYLEGGKKVRIKHK